MTPQKPGIGAPAWIAPIALPTAGLTLLLGLIGQPRAFGKVAFDPTEPSPSAFAAVSGRCDACHTVDTAASHPVDVAPSMSVPQALPLTAGHITCLTCHEASHVTHQAASTTTNPLLRGGASALTLCIACHDGSITDASSAHAIALGRAHPKATTIRSQQSTHRARGDIDTESFTCLACHDGSIARDAGHGGNSIARADSPVDHPIGVSMRGRSFARDLPLAGAETLDDRIHLYDGSVGCGSCHNLYSPIESRLVMSNYKSKLCLNCHRY